MSKYYPFPGRFDLLIHPLSWLFPRIDAALHHGGAGTTGASLRGKCSLLPILPRLKYQTALKPEFQLS